MCGVEVKEEEEISGNKRAHALNVKRKQLTISSTTNMTTEMLFVNILSETTQVKTLHCKYDVKLTLHCNYDVKYEKTFDDVKLAYENPVSNYINVNWYGVNI